MRALPEHFGSPDVAMARRPRRLPANCGLSTLGRRRDYAPGGVDRAASCAASIPARFGPAFSAMIRQGQPNRKSFPILMARLLGRLVGLREIRSRGFSALADCTRQYEGSDRNGRRGFPMTATPAVQRRTAIRRAAKALCLALTAAASCLAAAGCTVNSEVRRTAYDAADTDIPTEMQKVSIPPYRVEAPDILSIEAVNNIRPEQDPLMAGDELVIRASGTLPVDPTEDQVEKDFKQINGVFRVQTDGTVDLGPEYGSVRVEGLTLKNSREVVAKHLRNESGLANPKVAISLPNVNGKQQITGEHLIRPDGTVSLGVYGSVYVNGMTLDDVKIAVEHHLSRFMHSPEIQVDVLAYNSKVVYIVADGGGSGESVVRVPFTGNETVLDVMSQVDGLSEVAAKNNMWVARPGPHGADIAQKMYVDWRGITQDAVTTTNYQLLPGDRIYVKADPLIATDGFIAKITVPMSRLFGVTLLGNGTVMSIKLRSQQLWIWCLLINNHTATRDRHVRLCVRMGVQRFGSWRLNKVISENVLIERAGESRPSPIGGFSTERVACGDEFGRDRIGIGIAPRRRKPRILAKGKENSHDQEAGYWNLHRGSRRGDGRRLCFRADGWYARHAQHEQQHVAPEA